MGSILVVEDDDLNRKLFVSVLREKGYEVIEAADGGEAVEKIREKAPSLVLLDIVLPLASGFEVLSRCRAEGLLRGAKVYALTASPEAETGEAGFDGVIRKPVKILDFLRTVEETMRSLESEGER